jgi:asparaginyl-tRNA synthetase
MGRRPALEFFSPKRLNKGPFHFYLKGERVMNLPPLKRSRVVDLLGSDKPLDKVLVKGWVKTRRDSKDLSFIELGDGSSLSNLQLILPQGLGDPAEAARIATGAALEAFGELAASQGKGQKWELIIKDFKVSGESGPDYPLQKKRHTDEYLREIAHLRPRTNKYGAIFRLRSEASYAIHGFFRDRGFYYIHTPIITGNDCEGAGELFQVRASGPEDEALDSKKPYKKPQGEEKPRDFFGKPASLTVSGQLEAEIMAMALSGVYTFGPAFRAENSNTPRHAAEFWMIEPEAAFFDLDDDMDLAEDMIKSVVSFLMKNCASDLDLFDKFVEKGLLERLEATLASRFARVSYSDAIRILSESKVPFEFKPSFGTDIQTEHERFLAETYFKGPVFVRDYPKSIKPFYMRQNDDDLTVAAVDLLAPKVGELIGGSQREERPDKLNARLIELGLKPENYWWYLDLRRWGGTPHAGFGMGLERFLMFISGISNIRDVIPFPRTPGNLEF